jgi:hypothetical protein
MTAVFSDSNTVAHVPRVPGIPTVAVLGMGYVGLPNVGFWINEAAKIGVLTLNANTYCSQDTRGRDVAYNGSRVTPAAWRIATGDALSVFL